jgi:hypothetical protein
MKIVRLLAWPPYFFKNALNKSIGSGRNVVVVCSLAMSLRQRHGVQ